MTKKDYHSLVTFRCLYFSHFRQSLSIPTHWEPYLLKPIKWIIRLILIRTRFILKEQPFFSYAFIYPQKKKKKFEPPSTKKRTPFFTVPFPLFYSFRVLLFSIYNNWNSNRISDLIHPTFIILPYPLILFLSFFSREKPAKFIFRSIKPGWYSFSSFNLCFSIMQDRLYDPFFYVWSSR